jgi:hypothetical protein
MNEIYATITFLHAARSARPVLPNARMEIEWIAVAD